MRPVRTAASSRRQALRARETPEASDERRRLNRERLRRSRAAMDSARAAEIRATNATQHRRARAVQRVSPADSDGDSDVASSPPSRRLRRIDNNGQTRLASSRNRPQHWWDNVQTLYPSPPSETWRSPCSHCGAILLQSESTYFCCRDGTQMVPLLQPLPQEISELVEREAGDIAALSRKINRLFMLTVIGSNLGSDGWPDVNPGTRVVVLAGRTYHRLLPTSTVGHPIHWLLYDEQDRRRRNDQDYRVPPQWVQLFRDTLLRHNPIYRALERYRLMPDQQSASIEISLRDFAHGSEVAAVIHAANRAEVSPRAIYIFDRTHQTNPKQINILDGRYEPLQYPILFFNGESGWHPNYLSASRPPRRLTMLQYYRSRLLREEERFANFGHLVAEYIVDGYSRVEENRLDYIRASKAVERRRERSWENAELNDESGRCNGNGQSSRNGDALHHCDLQPELARNQGKAPSGTNNIRSRDSHCARLPNAFEEAPGFHPSTLRDARLHYPRRRIPETRAATCTHRPCLGPTATVRGYRQGRCR